MRLPRFARNDGNISTRTRSYGYFMPQRGDGVFAMPS